MRPATRSRPGRPSGRPPDEVRSALLAAAREQFSRRDFHTVSVRDLAHAAGVNAAMVNYYFGDKAGLYAAALQDSVGPLLDDLQGTGPGMSLSQFLARYIRILGTNPWLPNLVVREVLYGEGPFHQTFVERFAKRLGTALPALLRAEQASGRLRDDLDPTMAALSLLSMCAFPFIAQPVVEQGLNITMDEEFIARLTQHTLTLFYQGADSGHAGGRP